MNEGAKTITYVAVAVVVAGAAFISRPKPEVRVIQDIVGNPLFAEFDDPAKAASMEITRYDEEMGELKSFKVAREKGDGAWTIPSNSGYPADAEDRMRDAALMLVDLRVLGIASEVKGDHSMFGVVEPDQSQLQVGDEGVGELLSFSGSNGKEIAAVVIGKKVRGADDQRYVRVPNRDIVYTVKIDPERLSTKFEDWIETDLLQLSSWDVESVDIKNYTADLSLNQVLLKNNYDVKCKYEDSAWKLDELTRYNENQPMPGSLGSREELDSQKLNDLKTAVDDLKIVDVRRKPDGLGRDLKAGEGFDKDAEGARDLMNRGFYLIPRGPGNFELLSANGEIQIGMKDGVQYVLRFGEETQDSDGGNTGKNRYLFVMAQVDMSKFPEPELETVPELPEDAAADEESEATEADAEADEADADDAGTDTEAVESEIEKERERITKENQRKIDERNENIKKAKDKVAELNTRFGDWYYVVSDEQCQKIQLDLSDLIKEKEGGEVEGDDVDAFRSMQEEGLKSED